MLQNSAKCLDFHHPWSLEFQRPAISCFCQEELVKEKARVNAPKIFIVEGSERGIETSNFSKPRPKQRPPNVWRPEMSKRLVEQSHLVGGCGSSFQVRNSRVFVHFWSFLVERPEPWDLRNLTFSNLGALQNLKKLMNNWQPSAMNIINICDHLCDLSETRTCQAIMQEMISANVEKRTLRESLEVRKHADKGHKGFGDKSIVCPQLGKGLERSKWPFHAISWSVST